MTDERVLQIQTLSHEIDEEVAKGRRLLDGLEMANRHWRHIDNLTETTNALVDAMLQYAEAGDRMGALAKGPEDVLLDDESECCNCGAQDCAIVQFGMCGPCLQHERACRP